MTGFLLNLPLKDLNVALMSEFFFPISALTHILEFTTSPEVTQTVLELVRALIDCPVLALHLAKHTKLFETFLSHIVGK
jgi:hypothetical protein